MERVLNSSSRPPVEKMNNWAWGETRLYTKKEKKGIISRPVAAIKANKKHSPFMSECLSSYENILVKTEIDAEFIRR